MTKARDLANVGSVAAQGLNFRNRIINGDMRISQRNGTSSVNNSNNTYCLDRWVMRAAGVDNKHTAAQSSAAPSGFSNSLLITSSSAYSVPAGEYYAICQKIEGFNTADLAFGTSAAKALSLSFWVRSSLTGSFSGGVINSAADRSYMFSYSISSANTWEYKTVSIPGDTTGTWVGSTNGVGLELFFNLGAGSGYSTGAGFWSGLGYRGVTGAVNVLGTNAATWNVTGVQLEVGSGATPFESRPYGTELALCQRYFEKSFDVSVAPANGIYSTGCISYVCFADQWVFAGTLISFKVPKRASPTIGTYGTSSGKWQLNDNSNNWVDQGATGTGFQAALATSTTGFTLGVHNNGASGYAIGTARMIRGDWTASAEL